MRVEILRLPTLPQKSLLTAADPTKPVILVYGERVGIYGFQITGGSDGVSVENGSVMIVYNEIETNSEAGINVHNHSAAYVGVSDVYPVTGTEMKMNEISDNPCGIILSGSSFAKIVGNTITPSPLTTGIGDGIQVLKVSQADIADNVIDLFVHAVAVSGNSGVDLANGSSKPDDLWNTTDTGKANTGAVVARTYGGYVAEYLQTLLGGKPTFDPTCVNGVTQPSLVGTWNVTASSVSPSTGTPPTPPTSITFNSNGTGAIIGR